MESWRITDSNAGGITVNSTLIDFDEKRTQTWVLWGSLETTATVFLRPKTVWPAPHTGHLLGWFWCKEIQTVIYGTVLQYECNILMPATRSFYSSLLLFIIGSLFTRLIDVKAVQGLRTVELAGSVQLMSYCLVIMAVGPVLRVRFSYLYCLGDTYAPYIRILLLWPTASGSLCFPETRRLWSDKGMLYRPNSRRHS